MAKPNPAKLKDDATKFLNKGKLDKALEAYQELEKVSPEDLKVPQKIAEILLKMGKKEQAIAKYKDSAEKYRQRGFLVQAIAIYKVILGIDPKNQEISDLVSQLMEEKTGVPVSKKPAPPPPRPPKPKAPEPEEEKPPAVLTPEPPPSPKEPLPKEPEPEVREAEIALPVEEEIGIALEPETEAPPAETEVEAEVEIPLESKEVALDLSGEDLSASPEPGVISLEPGEEEKALDLDTQTPFEKGEVSALDLGEEAVPAEATSEPPIELGPPDQALGNGAPVQEPGSFDPMDFLETPPEPAGKPGEEKAEPEISPEMAADSGLELANGNPPAEIPAPAEIEASQIDTEIALPGEESPGTIELEPESMEVDIEMVEEGPPADVVPLEQEEELPAAGPERTPLFSDLAPGEFERVFELLSSKVVEPGTVIVKEGEAGDSIYIIARGEVRVTRRKEGIEDREVAILGPGSFFGEMGYFHGDRRATVTAVKKCLLLEMAKSDLDQVVSEFPRVKEVLLEFYRERVLQNLLVESPLFRDLSPEELQYFREQFEYKEFAPGEVIVKEGDAGDSMFLIKSGAVKVQTVHPLKEETVELARLSAGDFFGEVSLVKNKPRTATIVAEEPTEVLELSRASFQAIAQNHPEIAQALEQTIEHRVEQTIKKMLKDLEA